MLLACLGEEGNITWHQGHQHRKEALNAVKKEMWSISHHCVFAYNRTDVGAQSSHLRQNRGALVSDGQMNP